MVRRIEWNEVSASSSSDLLSQGLITSKNSQLLYTSGCVGTENESGDFPEDLESQVRNALENLGRILKVGQSNFDNVLEVLLFVAAASYASVVNKIYKEYFPSKPARSCIVVAFPNSKIKVELECIAEVIPDKM